MSNASALGIGALILSLIISLGVLSYLGVLRDFSTWFWEILNKYWNTYLEFIKVHKWLMILNWLAILLLIGNTLVPFFFGFFYICDDNDHGYIPNHLGDAIGWKVVNVLDSLNTTWTENINMNIRTYGQSDSGDRVSSQSYGLFNIGCNRGKTTLKLFGSIDIFDFKMWILLVIIAYIIPILWKLKYSNQ